MMRSVHKILCLLIAALFLCVPVSFSSPAYFEIPDGLVWFNSDRPVKISELKGKFVLVYFWNHAGANIRPVVDQYRKLNDQFAAQLVVISVHSGKDLDDDEINARVADAISVEHIFSPVVLDVSMQTLKAFRQDRFPSAVLIAPDGKFLTARTGERDLYSFFSRFIAKQIPRYQDLLNDQAIVFQTQPSGTAQVSSSGGEQPSADLADKALGGRLLGPVVLENSEESDAAHADLSIEQSESYPNDVVADQIGQERHSVDFSENDFVGEKVAIDREYSQDIGSIILKLRLPDRSHLLKSAGSYVRVFTVDRQVIAEQKISDLRKKITIDREIATDKLFIELMLYYCTQGNKSVCLMKPLLFKVPLVAHPKQEDIRIEYEAAGPAL